MLLLLALPAFAQVGEKITVNVVEVPVTVIDRDGDPLRGLTAANFELYDDGVRRAITAFDKVDFADQETASALSPLNPVARRSFMLLFDLGFSSPTTLARAQEAARRFVRDTVKPRDLVAVGTIAPEHGFRLLTAFTTDRDLVAAALAEPVTFRGTDPLKLANVTQTFEPPAMESTAEVPAHPALSRLAGPDLGDSQQRELAARTAQANEPFVRGRIETEIEGLALLAATLRAVPGRKQIVFLSDGFDPKYVRGRDVRDSGGDTRDLGMATAGQLWNIDSDARYGNSGSMKLIDVMAKTFRGCDVVLHAIDIEGLRVQNDMSGARISSNDGLFLLASPTGGEVFRNTNDLGTDFRKMLRQQEVVYVLGFQAPASKAGRFHGLDVRVVNVAGARPSFRAGYYESGPESPMQRTLSNAEIIINDIPQSDVRINALSAAFPAAGELAQVPVIVEIDGDDLLRNVKGTRVAAEMYIYAFDDEGLVRDRLYQKMSLDLSKVGGRLRGGGVKYYGTLRLPPGRYAVKTLVRVGENERRGFARSDMVVPKRGEMALASFFIDERPGDWLMVKGTSHDPGAAYPFRIGGEALVPSAAGRKLALIVYNARPNDLTVQSTPPSTVLRSVDAGDATQMVIQLDAAASRLEVSMRNSHVTIPTRTQAHR